MTKLRLTFEKKGDAKFISHLDLMRMFQRAFRRANVDIAFSEGFNPHPKMSIFSPLSIGVTGDNEYMEISVNNDDGFDEMINRLNLELPDEIKIKEYTKDFSFKLSDIVFAEYDIEVELCNEVSDIDKKIYDFLKLEEILIIKKTKRGEKEVNIKNEIKAFDVVFVNGNVINFKVILGCCENSNLKPQLLLKAMEKYIEEFKQEFVKINRNKFITLQNR